MPGRVALRVAAPEELLVATSLQRPGGWRARARGRRLETVTINGAFLGIHVPRGEHRLELRYIPPGLIPGLALAGVALAVCLVLLWGPRGHARSRRARASEERSASRRPRGEPPDGRPALLP